MSATTAKRLNPAFVEFVRAMPKAELHCHLDGSLRTATLLALSEARGIALPHHDTAALARWMRVDDAHNLEEYLARFEITLAVMQTPPRAVRGRPRHGRWSRRSRGYRAAQATRDCQ